MPSKERTGNVLVVEKDTSARQFLRALLKDDFAVFEAPGGAEALDLLRTVPIDTVTVDPFVPGIRGRELLSRIREMSPSVRVIIVTEHCLSPWFDDAVREEVFDYVPKPFESRELLCSVRRSMVQRRRGGARRPTPPAGSCAEPRADRM